MKCRDSVKRNRGKGKINSYCSRLGSNGRGSGKYGENLCKWPQKTCIAAPSHTGHHRSIHML